MSVLRTKLTFATDVTVSAFGHEVTCGFQILKVESLANPAHPGRTLATMSPTSWVTFPRKNNQSKKRRAKKIIAA